MRPGVDTLKWFAFLIYGNKLGRLKNEKLPHKNDAQLNNF